MQRPNMKPRTQRGWLATLAVAATFAAPAGAAETMVTSESVRQNLYSTCFVNEQVGWAVGDLGRIFYTKDGAQNWRIETAGTKRPFVSIACADENTAWAAGQAGQIAATKDGGATWQMLESGVEKQLLSIAFVDRNVGLAVGDYGTILRTEDGGATWTKIPVAADLQLPEDYIGVVEPGDVVLYSVAWGGPNLVAITGEFGVVMVSNDGGRTFRSGNSGLETTLFGVFFADDMRGWAVGMESAMLRTVDGGMTWEKQSVKTPPGFSLALYDLDIRGNNGWAVGNSGFLLRTQDAGASWTLIEVPPQLGSYWFREVSLLGNGKGFVVGSTGMVLEVDGDTVKPNKKQL